MRLPRELRAFQPKRIEVDRCFYFGTLLREKAVHLVRTLQDANQRRLAQAIFALPAGGADRTDIEVIAENLRGGTPTNNPQLLNLVNYFKNCLAGNDTLTLTGALAAFIYGNPNYSREQVLGP